MSLQAARNARPIGEDMRGRSLGFWGAVIGLIALFHLVIGAQVGAVYLRAASPSWPPGGGDPPGMTLSLVAVGLLALTAVLVTAADLQARRGRTAAAFLLPLGAVLAAVAGFLRGSVTVFADHPVAEHAYWAMHWFLGALDLVLSWSLALVLAVAAVHTWRGLIRPGYHAELAVTNLWAWVTTIYVLLSWLVFAGVTIWWGGA